MSSSAELPFVVEPPGSADEALAIAERAARRWGLPAPEPLRIGMNAVFAAGADVVLRVSRPTAPARAAVEAAELIARSDVRAPRHVRPEPHVEGDLAVFAVERIHPSGGHVDWARVGAMVRSLHGVDARAVGAVHPLPWCTSFPWWDFDAMLARAAPHVDDVAAGALRAAWKRHRATIAAVGTSPSVLLHGDVHPGNVIQTDRGPVLIDWDLLCVGPPGWDHAPLMTWTQRWGGEAGIIEAFRDGYGADLSTDRFAGAFAELRLLAATLMRVLAGLRDPGAAEEAQRRLRWWRGDPDAPQWQPS